MKGITVKELKDLCEYMVLSGYGDKTILISCDDEGNGFHTLFFGFMTNENDICHEWGKYLLDNVDRYIYKNPEVMIYGNDESRSAWFDKKDLKNTTELIINRAELPISATMLRQLMVEDKRREWMELVNPKLHKMYDEIRRELMSVEFYQNMREN